MGIGELFPSCYPLSDNELAILFDTVSCKNVSEGCLLPDGQVMHCLNNIHQSSRGNHSRITHEMNFTSGITLNNQMRNQKAKSDFLSCVDG